MRVQRCTSLGLAAWVLAGASGATVLDSVSPRDLMNQAELVFQGSVVDIQTRMSERGPGQVSLPHTFVTFTVERRFKGRAETGDWITLRFLGGPEDGGERGLRVEGVPAFDRGDRDVLFVRGNTTALCPLVGWDQGRFRLIAGRVYGERGQEVWLLPDGGFTFGAVRPLPEVLTHRVGNRVVGLELDAGGPAPVLPAGARRATESDFARAVSALADRHLSAAERAAAVAVPSAFPAQPLRVAAPRPVAPPPDGPRGGAGNDLRGEQP